MKKLEGDAGVARRHRRREDRHRIAQPAHAAAAAEVLLRSGKDVLVSRRPYDESQLIVVANGSFLLNLPLVNHEHRKLAGKLIDAVGSPRKTVVFLESYAGGPPIRDKDPAAEARQQWKIFNRLADQLDPAAPGRRGHHLLLLALADLRPPEESRNHQRLRFRPARRRPGRPAETLPRPSLRDGENPQLPTENGNENDETK